MNQINVAGMESGTYLTITYMLEYGGLGVTTCSMGVWIEEDC